MPAMRWFSLPERGIADSTQVAISW